MFFAFDEYAINTILGGFCDGKAFFHSFMQSLTYKAVYGLPTSHFSG